MIKNYGRSSQQPRSGCGDGIVGSGELCLGLGIALMMEAARTSETSTTFNVTTRRYIPEDCKLHTRRRENLQSHIYTLTLLAYLDHSHESFTCQDYRRVYFH
jgi:hypothetical protein